MIMPIFMPMGGGSSLTVPQFVGVFLFAFYLTQVIFAFLRMFLADCDWDSKEIWLFREYKSKVDFFFNLIPYIPMLIIFVKAFNKIGKKKEPKRSGGMKTVFGGGEYNRKNRTRERDHHIINKGN